MATSIFGQKHMNLEGITDWSQTYHLVYATPWIFMFLSISEKQIFYSSSIQLTPIQVLCSQFYHQNTRMDVCFHLIVYLMISIS